MNAQSLSSVNPLAPKNVCENSDVAHDCTDECVSLLELMDQGAYYDALDQYDPEGVHGSESDYFGQYESYRLFPTANGVITRVVVVEPTEQDLDYYNQPQAVSSFWDARMRTAHQRYFGDWARPWFDVYAVYASRHECPGVSCPAFH